MNHGGIFIGNIIQLPLTSINLAWLWGLSCFGGKIAGFMAGYSPIIIKLAFFGNLLIVPISDQQS